jgi:hypothetical protein
LLVACQASPLPPVALERSSAPVLSAPAPVLSAPAPALSAPAPVLSAPAPAALSAPPAAETAPASSASFTRDVDEAEQQRVLRASFPKFLRGACPPMPGAKSAGTWGRLSELQADAYRRGLFQPRVVQRITGRFTAPESEETLYLIEINPCVRSDFEDRLLVVFHAAELGTKSPRPFVRIELSRSASTPFSFVAMERREGRDVLLQAPGHAPMNGGAPPKIWLTVEATPGQGRLR